MRKKDGYIFLSRFNNNRDRDKNKLHKAEFAITVAFFYLSPMLVFNAEASLITTNTIKTETNICFYNMSTNYYLMHAYNTPHHNSYLIFDFSDYLYNYKVHLNVTSSSYSVFWLLAVSRG